MFDEIFRQFQEMKESLNDFKSHFTMETEGVPVLSKCMQLLSTRCGEWLESREQFVAGSIMHFPSKKWKQLTMKTIMLFNTILGVGVAVVYDNIILDITSWPFYFYTTYRHFLAISFTYFWYTCNFMYIHVITCIRYTNLQTM